MSFDTLPNDVIRHIVSFFPNTLENIGNFLEYLPQKKKRALFDCAIADFGGFDCVDLDHEELNENHHLIGIRTRIIHFHDDVHDRHDVHDEEIHQPETDNYLRIAQMCPNLEIIQDSIGYFSDEMLTKIVQSCPLLSNISIWCHDSITDAPFFEMAHNSKNLKSLYLCTEVDSKVSDVGLTAVLQGCSKIETLHISDYEHHFTVESYREISRLSSLLELYITNTVAITDEIIIQIASGCKNLKKLSVMSSNTSNECIIEVGRLCPKITNLAFTLKFKNFTSLIKIVEAFPNLLNISCYGMSTKENVNIMKKLKDLYPNLDVYPLKSY